MLDNFFNQLFQHMQQQLCEHTTRAAGLQRRSTLCIMLYSQMGNLGHPNLESSLTYGKEDCIPVACDVLQVFSLDLSSCTGYNPMAFLCGFSCGISIGLPLSHLQ